MSNRDPSPSAPPEAAARPVPRPLRLAIVGLRALAWLTALAFAVLVVRETTRAELEPPPVRLVVLGALLVAAPALLAAVLRRAVARHAAGAGETPTAAAWTAYVAARASVGPPRAEVVARWIVLGVVPGAILFRAHQVIAYGGPFGEWRIAGFGAWLRTLLAYGTLTLALIVLLAAAARAAAELVALAWTAAAPAQARTARRAAEWLVRAVLYGLVPALLVIRFFG